MSHFGANMVRLPVVKGALRGHWWLPASRGKLLRILGGNYEPEVTRALQAALAPGATFIDVGARVGYYTILGSVVVGDGGRVFAFEPNPWHARFLRRHVHINARHNVRIEEAAVTDSKGTMRLESASGAGNGARGGGPEVRTMRLDDFCADRSIAPAAIRIEAGGGEAAVLAGARETLGSARPIVIVSTRAGDARRGCLDALSELEYDAAPIGGRDLETSAALLATPR